MKQLILIMTNMAWSEMNPNIVFIQYLFMCVIKMSIHSEQDTYVSEITFIRNSQSKDWKAKLI